MTNPGDLRPTEASEVYLNSHQLKQRYGGVTDMCIYRWMKDERLGFPKPLRITERNLWKLSEIVAFEQRCAARSIEPTGRRSITRAHRAKRARGR